MNSINSIKLLIVVTMLGAGLATPGTAHADGTVRAEHVHRFFKSKNLTLRVKRYERHGNEHAVLEVNHEPTSHPKSHRPGFGEGYLRRTFNTVVKKKGNDGKKEFFLKDKEHLGPVAELAASAALIVFNGEVVGAHLDAMADKTAKGEPPHNDATPLRHMSKTLKQLGTKLEAPEVGIEGYRQTLTDLDRSVGSIAGTGGVLVPMEDGGWVDPVRGGIVYKKPE